MTTKFLQGSPTFTDCSGLAAPRSYSLVSSDPECRVTVLGSVDGSAPGPVVLRVLTPATTEILWETNSWLAFRVTAGNDDDPTVSVAGLPVQPGVPVQ